jgi:hypothetical protein
MTKIYTPTAARHILANIAEGLARLKEVEKRSLAAYRADWRTMAITERYLTQIVNYAIDVNRFVLHLAQVPAPDNYYDTFIELATQDTARTLGEAIGGHYCRA